jgi:hypothetical protein
MTVSLSRRPYTPMPARAPAGFLGKVALDGFADRLGDLWRRDHFLHRC